jgi:hypothetical protein
MCVKRVEQAPQFGGGLKRSTTTERSFHDGIEAVQQKRADCCGRDDSEAEKSPFHQYDGAKQGVDPTIAELGKNDCQRPRDRRPRRPHRRADHM